MPAAKTAGVSCSTMMFTPPSGRLALRSLMKLTWLPMPKTPGWSEKLSVAIEKVMKGSAGWSVTICRTPSFGMAVVPANGSVSKRKMAACAGAAVAIPSRTAATAEMIFKARTP
jgi:hypothetical protein